MIKKILEYFTNPCYSISRIWYAKREMIKMQDALTMKGIYEGIYSKAMSDCNIKPSKLNYILDSVILRLKLKELKRLSRKLDYTKYIEKNKEICNGEAVIIGTMIRPITIFWCVMNNIDKHPGNVDELLNFVKSEYPALDDKKILISLLYCFGYCKIKINSSKK